jgi:hypothetical protein
MKKIIAILTILLTLNSCSDLLKQREEHARTIIENVEIYRQQNKRTPNELSEIGMDDNQDSLSFYIKKSGDEYEVWYGLGLGTSKIYNSKTKQWREEG